MSSFLFALRVNPFPTLEVITPRYIVGSARGTINRLQRSFFFSSPLREIAQSSSAPFPSSDRGRENFQKKRKEKRKNSFDEFPIRFLVDPEGQISLVLRGTRLRGARFSRFRTRRILTVDRFLPWPRDKRGGGENKFVTEEPTRVCQNKEKKRKEKEEGRVRHEYSTGTKFLTYPTVY